MNAMRHLISGSDAADDDDLPQCQRCGALIQAPCATDEEAKACELPDHCWPGMKDGRLPLVAPSHLRDRAVIMRGYMDSTTARLMESAAHQLDIADSISKINDARAKRVDILTDLLLRWVNIALHGKYGERTATPLKNHPLVSETIDALPQHDFPSEPEGFEADACAPIGFEEDEPEPICSNCDSYRDHACFNRKSIWNGRATDLKGCEQFFPDSERWPDADHD